MTSSRDQILGRIRAATTSLPEPAKMPDYDPALSVSRNGQSALQSSDLESAFSSQWEKTKGRWAADWNALADLLKAASPKLGYCAPEFAEALLEAWPEAPVSTEFNRDQIDSYEFGITPAWGAIAETGTVILIDKLTPARLAALAPWTHVAIVPTDTIFPTVASAIKAFPNDPSIVMITGPSKTADIEGILIEGVHGPGVQVALTYER